MAAAAATWSESLPVDHLLFALFYVVVGFHAWSKRHQFAGLRARLSSAFSTCRSCSPDAAAEDAWVQAQMDEVRVRAMCCLTEVCSVMCMAAFVMLSAAWRGIAETHFRHNMLRLLALGIGVYIIALGVCCGYVPMSPRRARGCYVIMSAAGMLRMFAWGPSPFFYIVHASAVLFRATLSIAMLDARLTGAVNAVWVCVNIYLEVCQQQPLLRGTQCSIPLFVFVALELYVFIALQCICWFAVVLVESHVRLNLGMLVAGNVQQAVRRVLSVLCDADLNLTPDLDIRDPSHKVAHLLAPDAGASGVAVVEGRAFLDFVVDADQERFRVFLAASAGATSAGAEPPRSTQVELCDSTGCSVPVEVFHANLPDVQSGRRPGHLLGIRECAPAHRETSALAEPRGPTLGPGFPRPTLQAHAGPDVPTEGRDEGPGRLAQGLAGLDANIRAIDDSLSSHSSRSVATLVGRLKLPELAEIAIRFDALNEDMVVKELRVRFAAPGAALADPAVAARQHMPALPDWIHESMRQSLRDWIQENINALWNGREGSRRFGPVLLQWPSRGGAEEALVVEAAEAALDAADSEEEGSEGGAEEPEEEAMDAVLKLRSFQQVYMRPGRHRRQRSAHSHAQRSHRSGSRAGRHLPSIEEAAS